MEQTEAQRLKEIARLFLRLGFTAFGGPAAHIAMLHDEVVTRRGWLSEEEYLDLIGAANLIPGPNSTETVIHVGYKRGGWKGLIVAGVCFIMPAMLIVLALAWAYVAFGSMPQAEWLLYGVKPVVIAVVANALWNLGKKAAKTLPLALVGLAVLVLYFFGVNEILLLALGGGTVVLINLLAHPKNGDVAGLLPLLGGLSLPTLSGLLSVPFSLSRLFLTFLKIGSVLYGSGYVLLAFLRSDFVVRFGWLTDQQLIDAIAIGQVTPGPVFTTATFVGYVLGGTPGALLATLGIFLPAFVFVAISSPLIPKIRKSVWGGSLLDGVNAASLGLMAAVTIQLARASVMDWLTALVAVASFVAIFRYKVNTTWLIAGGAVIGVLSQIVL